MSVRMNGPAPVLTEETQAALQRGERVTISVDGRDTLALVPASDAHFLDALEDVQDVAAAQANIAADTTSGDPVVTLADARILLGL